MLNLDKLNFSQILKTPVMSFQLSLSNSHKQQIAKLYKRLEAYQITWRPHIWFADEWFCPNGVGGFAIPLSLGHKKLQILENKNLGFCEGASPDEFFKLSCHETGHALDNAFKLRVSKKRQNLFGKTSKIYPKSYKPNPFKTDSIDFLGDFYAQAHPEEDWAETVGYILYHLESQWHSQYKDTKAWEKLLYVKDKISHLHLKNAKNTTSLTPYHVKNDNRTFESYLQDKKKQFHLGKKTLFHKAAANSFVSNHIRDSHFNEAHQIDKIISKNQKTLINNMTLKTKISPWYIEKCLLELKKECKENQYQLKYNQAPSLRKIEGLVSSHLKDFIKNGHTRIYM